MGRAVRGGSPGDAVPHSSCTTFCSAAAVAPHALVATPLTTFLLGRTHFPPSPLSSFPPCLCSSLEQQVEALVTKALGSRARLVRAFRRTLPPSSLGSGKAPLKRGAPRPEQQHVLVGVQVRGSSTGKGPQHIAGRLQKVAGAACGTPLCQQPCCCCSCCCCSCCRCSCCCCSCCCFRIVMLACLCPHSRVTHDGAKLLHLPASIASSHGETPRMAKPLAWHNPGFPGSLASVRPPLHLARACMHARPPACPHRCCMGALSTPQRAHP